MAIRTVGKAGDKFVKEIESLKAQTISPNRIVVYIAEGFDLPPRVADEEYVVVPKGLVHQRAVIPDDEEVDYLLILDDDVFVPKDAVEQMFHMMEDGDCDCIIPDTFPSHRLSLWQKVIARCAHLRPDLDSYNRNRLALYEGLSAMGYEMAKPDGAFYLFVKAPGGDANRFSELAKQHDLLLLFPGVLLRQLRYDSKKLAGV